MKLINLMSQEEVDENIKDFVFFDENECDNVKLIDNEVMFELSESESIDFINDVIGSNVLANYDYNNRNLAIEHYIKCKYMEMYRAGKV